jgi:hypothetical protein
MKSDDFAIALPPDWRGIEPDAGKEDPSMAEISRDYPQIAALAEGVVEDNYEQPTIKLIALDWKALSGPYPVNIAIAKQVGANFDLEALVPALLEGYGQSSAVEKPIEHRREALPIGPAEYVQLHINSPIPINGVTEFIQLLYVIADEGRLYTIALNAPAGTEGDYEPVLRQIVETLAVD